MKTKWPMIAGVVMWLGLMQNLYANHNYPTGSPGFLIWEARELNQLVQRSWIGSHVKRAVYYFLVDVERLHRCVIGRSARRPTINNHLEEIGCPTSCRWALRQVQRSFQPVDWYLWDTYYDFPNIYRAYLTVKRGLRRLVYKAGLINPVPILP